MIELEAELKGYYEIVSEIISDMGNLTLRVRPQVGWSYFQGHFPSQPILPAVGIADISRYLVETYILKTKPQKPQKIQLKKISQFRIRTPVQPGQSMLVTIEKDSERQFHIAWKNETENSNSAELNLEWA